MAFSYWRTGNFSISDGAFRAAANQGDKGTLNNVGFDGYGYANYVPGSFGRDCWNKWAWSASCLRIDTTPTGSRLWLPSDLATPPKVWLDANALTGADGSTVSTFTDQEGHFDATLASGTGPVLRYAAQNSLKVVEFSTASAAKMTFSSSLMNGATQGCFFAVFKLKNDPTLNAATGGDAAGILDAFTSDTGGNLGSHHPYTDGVFYDHFGVSTRQTFGNPTPSFSSTYRLFNCEITSGGTYTNRIDATQFYQAVSQTVDFGAKTRNLAYTLGGGAFDFYLNGYVAEVLILDYVPSSAERAQIEGYLAWRWGEQANLPGGHTYAAAAPTIGSSGTVYTVTIQSISTPSPQMVRSPAKPLLTTSTPTPTLARATAKLLRTTSTPVPTLVRSTGKPLSTTSTPVPTLQRASAKPLQTTSTPVPTLSRAKITAKALATNSTPVPTLTRSTGKPLATASTPVPSLTRSMMKSFLTATTLAPGLVRSIGKPISGSSTPVPSLTHSFGKLLLGASTPVPSIRRSTAKGLQASSTPVPALTKGKPKVLLTQSVFAPTLTRQIAKRALVTSTPVPTLSARKVFIKIIQASTGGVVTVIGGATARVTAFFYRA